MSLLRVPSMASHLSGLNRSCHFSARSLNLLRSSCRVRTSSGLRTKVKIIFHFKQLERRSLKKSGLQPELSTNKVVVDVFDKGSIKNIERSQENVLS